MKPPRSALVVVTRRIGDVLLATPLVRSLRQAWPGVAIDVLVFAGTEGVLAANPDIRRVIAIDERPAWWRHFTLLAGIARRYDIALSAVPSDRPILYAWLAGRWRAGLVPGTRKHRWKTWLLQRWVPFDSLNTHTVLMHLALVRVLGIAPCYDVVAAWSNHDRGELVRQLPFELNEPYAVLHMFPKFNYKMWRRAKSR
jgi:heptosyltransferase-3